VGVCERVGEFVRLGEAVLEGQLLDVDERDLVLQDDLEGEGVAVPQREFDVVEEEQGVDDSEIVNEEL